MKKGKLFFKVEEQLLNTEVWKTTTLQPLC